MPVLIQVPLAMLEAVISLRFPERTDQRMQRLMDRNNEGRLSSDEREELAAWAELSESLAVVRAQAMHVLRRTDQ